LGCILLIGILKSNAYLENIYFKNVDLRWAPVAHACHPSLSEGRDQDGCDSKTAQANSLQDPISKKLITKKACRVTRGIGPEVKP
jgi:hypothetical protein